MNRMLKKMICILFALCLCCLPAAAIDAHGPHHENHPTGERSGVYCPYHSCYHNKKSNCQKYCTYHKTIHNNGKQHQSGVYCPYHKKYHNKKSNCKKYCTYHKTTHVNGRRHHIEHH